MDFPNIKEKIEIEEERLQNFLELSKRTDEKLNEGIKRMIIDHLRIPPEEKEPLKNVVEETVSSIIQALPRFFPTSEPLQEAREEMAEQDKKRREIADIERMGKDGLIQVIPELDTKILFELLEYIYKK